MAVQELWDLTSGRSFIDRGRLAEVVARVLERPTDPRSRELLHASRLALQDAPTAGTRFPSLAERLGTAMKKSTIHQYLRSLGCEIAEPSTIVIGGSSSLILADLLDRHTEDIDLVDEVPAALRDLHAWRDKASKMYGLYLAHFQSHYLPRDWDQRLNSLGAFGRLDVRLVDPIDILVGKLFSRRDKDLADLHQVLPKLSREQFDQRLAFADRLAAEPVLREQAERNYYVHFGDLPSWEP